MSEILGACMIPFERAFFRSSLGSFKGDYSRESDYCQVGHLIYLFIYFLGNQVNNCFLTKTYISNDCVWVIHTKDSFTNNHSLFLIAHSLQCQIYVHVTSKQCNNFNKCNLPRRKTL